MILLNVVPAPLIIATTDSSWLHQIQNWQQAAAIVGVAACIAYVLGEAFKRF